MINDGKEEEEYEVEDEDEVEVDVEDEEESKSARHSTRKYKAETPPLSGLPEEEEKPKPEPAIISATISFNLSPKTDNFVCRRRRRRRRRRGGGGGEASSASSPATSLANKNRLCSKGLWRGLAGF